MLLYLKHFRRNKYISHTLTNSTIIKDTAVEHQSRQDALSRFECVNTSFMRYIKPSGVKKKKSVGYSCFVNKKSKAIFQKLWLKGCKIQGMASPREPYVHTYNQGSVYREEWCSNPESNVLRLTRYCELVQLQNVRKEAEVSRGGQHRGTSPSRGVVTRKSLPGEGGAKGKLRGHSDQEVTRPKLPSITYGNGGMG